jgi:hypothetical protein
MMLYLNVKQFTDLIICRVTGVNGKIKISLGHIELLKILMLLNTIDKINLSFPHKSAFPKLRYGVVPIRIEAGRNLPENQKS